MSFWADFWGLTLLVSSLIFVVLVAVTAIGGFADLRSLMRKLLAGDEPGGEGDPSPSPDDDPPPPGG